jgi:Pyridoxamine 5'-phosphate oxidase
MQWQEFEQACPEIALLTRNRFARDGLIMLGTVRPDGWPRISPCEVDFAGGHLLLGMMWRSQKAMDLRRDDRAVVHSVTCDRHGTDGDLKLYGRAVEVSDPALREAYRQAIQARIDWAPDEPEYHLFSIDIQRAGYIVFGEAARVLAWDGERGLRRPPPPA